MPRADVALSGPKSVSAGDLNGDQLMDLAVANAGSGTISILLGDGRGGFNRPIDFGLPPIPSPPETMIRRQRDKVRRP